MYYFTNFPLFLITVRVWFHGAVRGAFPHVGTNGKFSGETVMSLAHSCRLNLPIGTTIVCMAVSQQQMLGEKRIRHVEFWHTRSLVLSGEAVNSGAWQWLIPLFPLRTHAQLSMHMYGRVRRNNLLRSMATIRLGSHDYILPQIGCRICADSASNSTTILPAFHFLFIWMGIPWVNFIICGTECKDWSCQFLTRNLHKKLYNSRGKKHS